MKTIITLILCLFTMTYVWSQCESAFEYQQNELEIIFTNTSTATEGATVDFVNWTMGDGEEIAGAFEENFTYSYDAAGTYEVCLHILTSDFCEQESCQTIEIQACTASFTVEPNSSGSIYFLEDNSTVLSDIITYEWTINGIIESDASSFYTGLFGPSNICLFITTSDGCESEYCEYFECPIPSGLTAYSDSLYQISLSTNMPEGPESFHFEIYDQDGYLVESVESESSFITLENNYFTPCDTFKVVAFTDCSFDFSEASDTIEVISLCYGCEIELNSFQLADYYVLYNTDVVVIDLVESYTFTVDGEWVSNEDDVYLIVENGQEVCVTIITEGGCTATDCEIVNLPVPTCPSPEILSITENEFGDVTVTIEGVPEASTYVYDLLVDYEYMTGISETSYDVSTTSYTFEDTNILPCAEYQVKVRSKCAGNYGYYSLYSTNNSPCEDGCAVTFTYSIWGGGEYQFKPDVGTLSEVSEYEWTVDGEVVSNEEVAYINPDEMLGQLICISITTIDECVAEHCEMLSNECADPMDITTISNENTLAIYYNGAPYFAGLSDVEEFTITIYDELGLEVLEVVSEEEYIILDVEGMGLEACQEYTLEVDANCGGFNNWGNAEDTFVFNCEEGCIADFDFIGQGSGVFNCINTTATLTAIDSYSWTIDGELLSEEANPTLEINEVIGQEVCLSVTTLGGCNSEYCEFIQSSCPYTEIISIDSYGPNQINLTVIEDDPSYAFETLIFDTYGNLVFTQNTLGPVVNIQDASIFECTEYNVQVIVKCQGGIQGFASAPTIITTECAPGYCPSAGEGNEYILNVNINTIDNNSGDDNGYGDYTNYNTFLNIGDEIDMTLTPGFNGTQLSEAFFVFIDLNADDTFTIDELVAQSEPAVGIANLSFTVPETAALGETTMRIVMSFNGEYILPCGFYQGETEDYTITIQEAGADFCAAHFDLTYHLDNMQFTLDPISNTEITDIEWTLEGVAVGNEETVFLNPFNNQEVCVNITSQSGCEDSFCQTIEFGCNVSFNYSYGVTGIFPVIVFDANSDSETPIFEREWRLNNEIVSEIEDYVHIDGLTSGSHEFCYRINVGGGGTCTECEIIEVDCQAGFTHEPSFSNELNILFTVNPTADIYNYKWEFGDGEISTANSSGLFHSYDEAGIYEVCLTIRTEDACFSTHCENIGVGVPYTNTENILNLSSITNYPNPSNQSTTISFREDIENTELIITNIMGQEIAHYKIAPNNTQIEINTSNLPNGTYLYQLKNKSGTIAVNKMLVLH